MSLSFSILLIFKTISTIIYGALILRIAGRKSLSQMTIAQTVVMLAVGTVLIEPLVGNHLIDTYIIVAVAVFTLIMIEFAEIKIPYLKKLFTGEPVIIIKDGKIDRESLKRVRMTIQQVEMELRQASISTPSEVKWATLEPNGQFGYMLKDEFQNISKKEYQHLLNRLAIIEKRLNIDNPITNSSISNDNSNITSENIFEKILNKTN